MRAEIRAKKAQGNTSGAGKRQRKRMGKGSARKAKAGVDKFESLSDSE